MRSMLCRNVAFVTVASAMLLFIINACNLVSVEDLEELRATIAATTVQTIPSDGSTNNPLDGSTNNPLDGSTDNPSDGSTDNPSDGSTDNPSDGSTKKPSDGSTKKPVDTDNAYDYLEDTGDLNITYSAIVGDYEYYSVKVGTIYNVPISEDLNENCVFYGGTGSFTITSSVAKATSQSIAKQSTSTTSRTVYDDNLKAMTTAVTLGIPSMFTVGLTQSVDTYQNYTTTSTTTGVTTTDQVTQTNTQTFQVNLTDAYPKGWYKVCYEASYDVYCIIGIPLNKDKSNLKDDTDLVLSSTTVIRKGIVVACLYSPDCNFVEAEKKEYPISHSTYERALNLIKKTSAANFRYGTTADSIKENNKDNWNKGSLTDADELFVGVCLPDTDIDYFKIVLNKDGKNIDTYTLRDKNINKENSNFVWGKCPTTINFLGQMGIKIEVKYTNGGITTIDGGYTTVVSKYCGLKKLEFAKTGLPARLKPSGNVEYFEYGIWPQSLKKDDVTVTKERHPRNKNWFKGSDGEWYEKAGVRAWPGWSYNTMDGRTMRYGNEYWFKVEPIVWQRMPGTNKLMSARGLDARWFQNNDGAEKYYGRPLNGGKYGTKRISEKGYSRRVFANNYTHSDIRAWLNGIKNQSLTDGLFYWHTGTIVKKDDWSHADFTGKGFIDYAFSAEQRAKLETVQIVNNAYENHIDNVYKDYKAQSGDILPANSYDKVWLWSKQEITKSEWGFQPSGVTDSKMRMKAATDYSAARGVSFRKESENTCRWWLRSPNYRNTVDGWRKAQTVDERGHANSGNTWDWTDLYHCAIVPGIQLPASMLNTAPAK